LNKFAIPSILVAIVMIAGMFAFSPVEQASTTHTGVTGVLTSTLGLVCVTEEDVVLTDAAPNADVITFTFSQPILLTQILVNADASLIGDTLNLTAWSPDGALYTNNSVGTAVTDTVSGHLLADSGSDPTKMMIQNTLAVTVNDASVDQDDIVSITFCGLTEDSQNFTSADITSGVVPG